MASRTKTLATVMPVDSPLWSMDRQQIVAIVFVMLMVGSSIIYGASFFF